jgi:hypothetical protein
MMDLSLARLVLLLASFVHSGNRHGDIYRFADLSSWMLGRRPEVYCVDVLLKYKYIA